jgi:double-stranded uracil-DNA glycosylase
LLPKELHYGAPMIATETSKGFAAVCDPSACVLILGSLPGVVSLEQQEYYAKPQNVFWRIMGSLFGAEPDLPYAQRTRALTEAGIALWDVCASAHRIGSLDSAIKHHAANDFEKFFTAHPNIELVCFNGQKAAALYRRSVHGQLPPAMQLLPVRVLPSTSPANAGLAYEEKLRQWSSLLSAHASLRRASTTHKGSASAGERSRTEGSS